jgi:hypothetical protein
MLDFLIVARPSTLLGLATFVVAGILAAATVGPWVALVLPRLATRPHTTSGSAGRGDRQRADLAAPQCSYVLDEVGHLDQGSAALDAG